MPRRLIVLLLVGVLALAAFAFLTRGNATSSAVVARVIDGDTIELVGGQRERLIPAGTHVRIEQDPKLDQVDRYRRKLAYVWRGDEDVNVTLVRDGAAGVWFFGGKRGRYAKELLSAAEEAQAERRGLWRACPLARFDPNESMSSGPSRE